MGSSFGETLKRLRLSAGIGLRKFAEMVDTKPSNLSAIEHGRRGAPTDSAKLEEMAETLGLSRDSDGWDGFFDAARRERGGLPADVRHMADRRLVPTLLRTIDNKQLTEEQVADLIDDIKKGQGGPKNLAG